MCKYCSVDSCTYPTPPLRSLGWTNGTPSPPPNVDRILSYPISTPPPTPPSLLTFTSLSTYPPSSNF
ncbi:hypothetical protein BJ508DRAFT_80906 [Ascobolus immersus RN42]|uniref:Uncharacterized protein n=1 Tax=Ascobolus immersus RN42 TaxID=1160509 RepID=A0A3N4IBQ4_ASCIM|nr:hypothetical protein BJ508DRAFT_80906 [Ascobolus immersus RN42]